MKYQIRSPEGYKDLIIDQVGLRETDVSIEEIKKVLVEGCKIEESDDGN